MCGGGNMAGKLMVVVRKPPAEASDQMVSHCTSLELKKRMCRLTGESMRKKSNTPCCPGVRPVIREVQAGGVSGGTMVRNPARAPSAKNDFKKGHDALFHERIEDGERGAVQADEQRADTHCTRLVVSAPVGLPRWVFTKSVSSSIDRSRCCWPISANNSAKGIGV